MATVREALGIALDHHMAGRVAEAETLYRRILDADSANPDALHLFGVLCAQTGRLEDAVALLCRAVAGNRSVPDYHVNLANALRALGRAGEAAASYRAALELAPQRADAGFGLAVSLEAAGQAEAAVDAYRTLLDRHPGHAEGWNNLGLLQRSQGALAAAVAALSQAARLAPQEIGVQLNLGLSLSRLRRGTEASAAFRRALALDPASRTALQGLAGELTAAPGTRSTVAEAIRCQRRLLRLQPDCAAAHAALAALDAGNAETHRRGHLICDPADPAALNGLGLLRRRAGLGAEAALLFRRAAILLPDSSPIRSHLAVALRDLGQPDAALTQARTAVALAPAEPAILSNLALVWEALDRPGEADAVLRRALRVAEDDDEAWAYLGAMLRRQGRIADGLAACDRALALAPASPSALAKRAVLLQDLGRAAAAVADNRRLVALAPDRPDHRSNLLLALQYDEAVGVAQLLAEHRAWDERHGRRLAAVPGGFANRRDPGRRLRIGYVSADFGYHPIGYFLAPVLPAHDRSGFEIFCYSGKLREDGMTRRLRAAADHWRPICGVGDEAAEATIRADGIDILVDLSGHTADNRLPLFARRATPVQVTWAGYVGTTGLSAMDALIACPRHMPPGSDWTAVERVIRLPDDYVCVLPRENAPEVGPLPALANGVVTFGCFNNRIKLSPGTLSLWGQLLARLPTARLLLKTHQFDDPAVCAGLLAEFAALGGDPSRVDFSGRSPHFEMPGWYNRIDVALDPFPYSGGLTTLEALWMGVPVVTLGGGDRFCARHSVGHLTAVGMPETIAADRAAYLDIAAGLACDLDRLAALRRALRPRMADSAVCDGPRFTRHLEAAFRGLWQDWCARAGADSGV